MSTTNNQETSIEELKDQQNQKSILDVLEQQNNDQPLIPLSESQDPNDIKVEPIQKDKKPSEMTTIELYRHICKSNRHKFLIVNDNGDYEFKEHTRRSLNDKIIRQITELRDTSINYFNLERKLDEDKKSRYYNNHYYEYDGIRFYSGNSMADYYFKKIINLAYKIPIKELDNYAIYDDPDVMDTENAYCLKTLAKLVLEINNVGLSYFQTT